MIYDLEMTVTVQYDIPAGTSEIELPQLEANLKYIIDHARMNGAITQDTEAEMKGISVFVTEV